MREIKFRAWDTQFKRMLNNVAVCNGIVPHIGHHCEAMQFTGLQDTNGKEIYEGDIVREMGAEFYGEKPFQIEFSEGCFVLTRKHALTETVWEKRGFPEVWEVIGNVFENKELLNDNKKTKED